MPTVVKLFILKLKMTNAQMKLFIIYSFKMTKDQMKLFIARLKEDEG